jgi:hypothetical protein
MSVKMGMTTRIFLGLSLLLATVALGQVTNPGQEIDSGATKNATGCSLGDELGWATQGGCLQGTDPCWTCEQYDSDRGFRTCYESFNGWGWSIQCSGWGPEFQL